MYIKKYSGYVLKNDSSDKNNMVNSNYFRLKKVNFITSKTNFEDLTVIMKYYQIRLTLECFLDSVSSIQHGLDKNKDYKRKENFVLDRIEKVATKISEDFFQAALKTYLNKYYQTVFKYQDYTGVYSDFPAPSEDMFNSISNKKKEIYEKCKRKLNQQMDNLSNYGNRDMMIKNSTKECESIWREIHEAIHIYEIQGGLAAIHMLGLEVLSGCKLRSLCSM